MTDQPVRIAARAALRRSARLSRFARQAAAHGTATVDRVLALLIILAGLMAWSPRIALAAAREAVAARRARRRAIAQIGPAQDAVWARHIRRNLRVRACFYSPLGSQPPIDP